MLRGPFETSTMAPTSSAFSTYWRVCSSLWAVLCRCLNRPCSVVMSSSSDHPRISSYSSFVRWTLVLVSGGFSGSGIGSGSSSVSSSTYS